MAGKGADGSSPVAPPPRPTLTRPSPAAAAGAFWAAGSSAGNSPNQWSMDPRPPGGFMSYFQHQQFPPFQPQPYPSNYPPHELSSDNSHFVGVHHPFAAFSPPPTPHTKGSSSPSLPKAKVAPSKRVAPKKMKQAIILDDDDDECDRTAARLAWSHEEDKRLASAWLENSNDPIDGNNKKFERYWNEIAADYNSNTPKDRRREATQLKLRFHRVKAIINDFHGCWISVTRVYKSGYSDDQLIDMALEKYQVLRSKSFTLLHMWKVLKEHGKWLAYIARLKEEPNKSPSVGIDLTTHVVDVGDEQRPIGCKPAKAERNGKRKEQDVPKVVMELGVKLDKFIEFQTEHKQQRQKIVEAQQQMSREKLETAKIENQTKLLDVYKELMLADTRGMDENAKTKHDKALANMESILFPKGD